MGGVRSTGGGSDVNRWGSEITRWGGGVRLPGGGEEFGHQVGVPRVLKNRVINKIFRSFYETQSGNNIPKFISLMFILNENSCKIPYLSMILFSFL